MNRKSNAGRGGGKDFYKGYKPVNSEIIFNGGSAYDFILARSKLRQKFIENKCWSYVAPAAVGLEDVGDGFGIPNELGLPHPALPAAIIEDIFDMAKPRANMDYADQLIQDKIDGINEVYNLNEEAIHDVEADDNYTEAQRNLDLMRNDRERRLALLKAEQSRDTILASLLNSLAQWNRDKAVHEEKQGACMKVFTTYLGPGPQSAIHEELSEMRFRAAWAKLNATFSLGNATQQSVAQMTDILTSAVYNRSKSIQEHVEEMMLLSTEIKQAGGYELPSEILLQFIIKSIENSSSFKDFEDDIKAIRRSGNTLLQAQTIFQNTQSNLDNKKLVEKLNRKREREQGKYSAFGGAATVNKPKKSKVSVDSKHDTANVVSAVGVCKHCGSKTHSAERCWTVAKCRDCNKIGHIARFCPDKPKDLSARKVAVTDVFVKK